MFILTLLKIISHVHKGKKRGLCTFRFLFFKSPSRRKVISLVFPLYAEREIINRLNLKQSLEKFHFGIPNQWTETYFGFA